MVEQGTPEAEPLPRPGERGDERAVDVGHNPGAVPSALRATQLRQLQSRAGNSVANAALKPLRRPLMNSAARARFDRFVQTAGRLGVGFSAASRLWDVGGGAGADPLSGFALPTDVAETQELAGHHSSRFQAPAYRVRAEIRNLGGLNSTLGNSGTNAVYRDIALIVQRQIEALGHDVEPYRIGGPEFGFVVVSRGPPDRAEGERGILSARLNDASTLVDGYIANSGLSRVAHPKHPDDRTEAGAGVILSLHELNGDAGAPGMAAPPRSPTAGTSGSASESDSADQFLGTAEQRDRAFMTAAAAAGLSRSDAEMLYGMTAGSDKESLTGFAPASERMPTVASAAKFAREHGVSAVYVEVDVRNVSGLNDHEGPERTDAVIAKLAHLVETALGTLPAKVCPFRHGGDELSFVVVGAAPRAGLGDLIAAVRIVLESAERSAQAELAEFSEIRHPKHPERRGTGIVFGTARIDGRSPEEVVAEADQQVERRKVASPSQVQPPHP